MFGKITIQIKLIEGDSAGTVTAIYVKENYIHMKQIFLGKSLSLFRD